MTQSTAERRFSKLAAAINQKARKLGAPGTVSATDLALVFLAFNRKCAYCGFEISAAGVSFDHVVPFVKGGANTIENLAASCMTCQRGKFTKTPEEWAAARNQVVICEVCKDPKGFKPRWADWVRGYGRTCSRKCSGQKGGESDLGGSSSAAVASGA